MIDACIDHTKVTFLKIPDLMFFFFCRREVGILLQGA